jgi:hypothetical protein
MSNVYEWVAAAPIFEGLDRELLEFIAAGAEEVTVSPGTLVLAHGELAGTFSSSDSARAGARPE